MVPIMQECVDHMMHRFTSSCDSGKAVDVFRSVHTERVDIICIAIAI